jgi:hypothetical protein
MIYNDPIGQWTIGRLLHRAMLFCGIPQSRLSLCRQDWGVSGGFRAQVADEFFPLRADQAAGNDSEARRPHALRLCAVLNRNLYQRERIRWMDVITGG